MQSLTAAGKFLSICYASSPVLVAMGSTRGPLPLPSSGSSQMNGKVGHRPLWNILGLSLKWGTVLRFKGTEMGFRMGLLGAGLSGKARTQEKVLNDAWDLASRRMEPSKSQLWGQIYNTSPHVGWGF